MAFALPALVEMYEFGDDVTYLTDESRTGVSIDLDQRFVEKTLASGRKKRFLLRNCHTFSVGWEMIPANAAGTIDGFLGRDEIKALANLGVPLVFTLRADNDTTMYDALCFVTDYSEEIVFRRGTPDNFRYKISLSLEQIS